MKLGRILLDVETQREFFEPGGEFFTQESARILRNIYRLFTWARLNRIPVISTVLRVPPNRIGPLSDRPHCIEDSDGEGKLARTVLRRRIDFGLRNTTDLPRDIFKRYQQVIFEKRVTDIFAHSRAERLITELTSGTFIICGAGVGHGIVEAAVGLRSRGFGVILASDAVLELPGEKTEMAYLRMEAKGVIFAPAKTIVVPLARKPVAPFRSSLLVAK
jgi:nicotinamidase-related amidase